MTVNSGSGMFNTLIQSDPDVMLGKPVVHGTRITVELTREKQMDLPLTAEKQAGTYRDTSTGIAAR